MPPHAGHKFLMDFAASFCDEVTVLVCSLPTDPIPGGLRYRWVRELAPGLTVHHLADEMPQDPTQSDRFWPLWREAILRCEPRGIDFVFASEPYGERLAAELGARFIPVDLHRQIVPCSGTAIRSDPMAHWAMIPECVRPYFVKRVCLVGPESSGKSTLAARLAARFNTVRAWEHARPLLDLKAGRCDAEDIPVIAQSQTAIEDVMARRANRVLFCDTSVLLTKVWSDVLFSAVPPAVADVAARVRYDLALLLAPDIPWVDDSQRYFPNQDDRDRFFEWCRVELERVGQPYVVISGTFEEREERAVEAVRRATGIAPVVDPPAAVVMAGGNGR